MNDNITLTRKEMAQIFACIDRAEYVGAYEGCVLPSIGKKMLKMLNTRMTESDNSSTMDEDQLIDLIEDTVVSWGNDVHENNYGDPDNKFSLNERIAQEWDSLMDKLTGLRAPQMIKQKR